MKTYQFKTNINCGGCVAAVTPHLNGKEDIRTWKVDTANPSKILTIETEKLDAEAIEKLISKAGFKAEKI